MAQRFRTRSSAATCTFLLALAWSAVAAAAPPTITNLSLRGLQAGGTTVLAIDGQDLLPEPRLLTSVPIARQSLKAGGTAQRIELEVALDAQAPVGIHLVRLATSGGVSNSVAVGVDRLPQAAFAPECPALPVSMTGSLSGSTVMTTTFAGKQGERVVVEVESRRLGANLSPVVHLYDSRHVQLAWSPANSAISGDARCEAVLPADGAYSVELHDMLYRGAEPGFFRLKIGSLHYADLAFPLGVQQGKTTAVQLLATSLSPSDLGGGIPFAAEAAALGPHPVAFPPALAAASGSRPVIVVSDFTEAVEDASPSGKPQDLGAAPVAVSGRLSAAQQEDRYRLAVKPGESLRLDVQASRLGAPLDGVLTVLNEQGGALATSDDRPGTTDPGLDFTVPAGASALLLSLGDLRKAGGEKFIYRLEVRALARPDFSVSLAEDRLLAPRGGAAVLRARAARTGFGGPIQLTFQGLPSGITVAGDVIPAGASESLVTFTAGDAAPAQGLVAVFAESADPQTPLKRPALVAETPVSRLQPWLRREMAVAVTPASDLAIAWEGPSADGRMMVGAPLPGKVTVTRAASAAGALRLSLLTSQAAPKKTVKVNNVDQSIDDVDRMIRLEGAPVVAAGANEMAVNVLTPGDLPIIPYDLAIQAELLGADNKTVLASAVTPARRLTAVSPVSLELAGPPQVEVRAGAGPTGKLKGKVVRAAGFVHPVKLTLTGLPAGVLPPATLVPGDKQEFEFAVALPFGTAAGPLGGVKLLATSQVDPKNAGSIVRTSEIPLTVTVVAGEKPPVEKPLAVFEDQSEFIANLSEGAGKISLAADDKYSGTSSAKVTPDHRQNAMLPGLGVKIRENPAAGEYRYLRFAWKKQGGATICLQINHDGQWGPVAANPGKFRYHAGPGPECYNGSLVVDSSLPTAFTVVTRDLFADFGEFTFTGLGLSALDGEFALFDHIYLGRQPTDFDSVKP